MFLYHNNSSLSWVLFVLAMIVCSVSSGFEMPTWNLSIKWPKVCPAVNAVFLTQTLTLKY